jgi:phage-related baseplate assembly protein
MTTRFVAANLDLSRLAAPEVIQTVSYEAILAERLADLKERWPDLDTTGLETEPAVILQQEDAYRETLTRAAINDAARSVMLPFATGGNLDNLAVFYGIRRLLLQAATDSAPAVYESDDDLRVRVQLAPEALPYAGMTGGGYRSLALRVAPSVKDVYTVKRDGGRVDVVLLGRTGSGTVASGVVSDVYTAFQDDAATQLTDVISVMAATITSYALNVKLYMRLGPDPAAVRASALAAINAYVTSRHKIAQPVYGQMIEAMASVGGVERAAVQSFTDINPGSYGAAYCTGVTITTEIVQ